MGPETGDVIRPYPPDPEAGLTAEDRIRLEIRLAWRHNREQARSIERAARLLDLELSADEGWDIPAARDQ